MKIEIFKRKNLLLKTRWYFRVRARNGEIVAHSEAYNSGSACRETIELLQHELGTANVFFVED